MKIISTLLILLIGIGNLLAQDTSSNTWTLEQCINHALSQNIQVQQTLLTNLSNQVDVEQAKAQKLPSLNASVSYTASWSGSDNTNSWESDYRDNQSNNFSLNSSVTLFNSGKLTKLIEQAKIDMEAGIYDSEAVKETVSLNILNAFMQVIFNKENVENAKIQMEATQEQAEYAEARYAAGAISKTDYLQVKSQLATEKSSLISAQSELAISKVNLMQMMLLPVSNDFDISYPELAENINQDLLPDATEVYSISADIRPTLRSAAFQKQSAELNEKIAKAGYMPVLSANTGLSTGYSNTLDATYTNQLNDRFTPNVGLTLSIPIFQNKQVKTSVAKAKISYQNAELTEKDEQNTLRMNIEQVCLDVMTSQYEFEAYKEVFEANEESYALAEEKYKNGLMNSVDFIFEKNNLIQAQSSFLQSKYKLLFNYKILDFYKGQPITL
ncbi:TolC family protein [Carboxylicivirga caseinilyticus]|uniref:TolC family protein n=1 Tax=Carboxylicivirga caseinilyticus TaxID=3417572 RepID=UPI003D3432CA|nr:TolC family protein [Marinilabiliaceae bacterium A049]